MRKTGLLTVAITLLALIGVQDADAQIKAGPRVGYGTDFDFAVGATGTYAFDTVLFDGAGPLHGSLTFDLFFPDCGGNCSFFELVPTVFVPIQSFYAGAGLDIARYSVDVPDNPFVNYSASATDIGLAIHGGYMLPLGSGTGMIDARFGLAGSDQLTIAFSYLFNLGGSDDGDM